MSGPLRATPGPRRGAEHGEYGECLRPPRREPQDNRGRHEHHQAHQQRYPAALHPVVALLAQAHVELAVALADRGETQRHRLSVNGPLRQGEHDPAHTAGHVRGAAQRTAKEPRHNR